MAQYRFSAQVIGRASGRSAVAAAAYRAGEDLTDERTGLAHSFSRRSGVVSAEILAPDDAPRWVHDRAELWNAVEKIETRVNSQLAREIQLSLPHELNDAQRRELLHDFVREQFVSRGMIADVAIHRPDRDGDERNHHSHVMLTMREITREGFHASKSTPTARAWNAKENVELWRERWAEFQNRALERVGSAERVDHRSLEARGIDREPTQHLGPAANDMERQGRPSRIGDENRAREARNDDRSDNHHDAAIINLALEREKRSQAQPVKGRGLAATAWNDRRRTDELTMLETRLQDTYGEQLATLTAQRDAISSRMQVTGWRRILRGITGQSRADQIRLERITDGLAQIEQHRQQQRDELTGRHQREQRPAEVESLRDYWTSAASPAAATPAETPLRDYWSAASSGAAEGPSENGREGPEPSGPERDYG